ncbi:hypothetical protein B7494_g6928 [Chlorociboria aeruginascens]|nr:hypothetical protein B7494_g6928 [Chlorociboria aeruginascens]
MPSIGPTLPPHLTKRKRSIEDPEPPNSPPPRPDDSSDDDSYGPSKLISSTPTKRVPGPAGPSSAHNPDEVDLAESLEEDDSYGPSNPNSTSNAQPIPQKPKRVLGPSAPPASLSERPPDPPNAAPSDSESDDYGPSLPPAAGTAAHAALTSRLSSQSLSSRNEASVGSSAPQRAEWMLVPPSSLDFSSRADPTKLKNRKFATGKGAKAPAEKGGVSSIWTETAAEKMQRLSDEVLGRKEKGGVEEAGGRKRDGSGRGRGKEDEETERRIREYNEKVRNKSLLEEREAGKGLGARKEEEEDDPSKRGFDREKDMGLGGRVGEMQKREMLSRAKDFGSRFQKGSYL